MGVWDLPVLINHTAKTKYRNFETNIPRNGISGPQSQFPHSCVCERFIYSHDRSPYSAGGNMYRSWDYINRSQTHECCNWGWGRAIPRKGIYKWDSPCSAFMKWHSRKCPIPYVQPSTDFSLHMYSQGQYHPWEYPIYLFRDTWMVLIHIGGFRNGLITKQCSHF